MAAGDRPTIASENPGYWLTRLIIVAGQAPPEVPRMLLTYAVELCSVSSGLCWCGQHRGEVVGAPQTERSAK